MDAVLATSAGHRGRVNEDFVGATSRVAVMVDGAGIPGAEHLCHHGVAWYARSLGAALMDLGTRESDRTLAGVLAESIERVADRHRDTCALTDPASPQATVAMVRVGERHVEYLALADAFAVLDRVGEPPLVVTDPRELAAREAATAGLRHLPPGSDEDAARSAAIERLRAQRNRPGGYWIAKEDPAAAAEAVTGSIPVDRVSAVALLSNGASRIVSPYGLADWPQVLALLDGQGPDELLRRIREAERRADDGATLSGYEAADDASVVFWPIHHRDGTT